MNEFRYKNNSLHCEGVALQELADRYGTPLYVYSQKAFINRYREVRRAFSSLKALVCCSVKANSNLAVLKTYASMGGGADIVSGGELYRALKAGIRPERIVYAGVGKTAEEIAFALKSGIRLFNVESMPELTAIDRIAARLKLTARVGLRINPDVDAKTHHKTTTGRKENKFGLPLALARDYFSEALRLGNVRVTCVDMHLGSPIFSTAPYEEALRKILPLVRDLQKAGARLEEIDIGGGFGIVYNREKPFTPAQLSAKITPLIRKTGLGLICEPGRYLTGNSGVLLARVLYLKKTDVKDFVITDTGMNDLIRPAFYDSHHAILPAVLRARPSTGSGTARSMVADVVGPICESSDYLAKERALPPMAEGDVLAVMSAGAYGFAMASNYNARPRAAEIMVDGSRARVVRRREQYADLVRGEE